MLGRAILILALATTAIACRNNPAPPDTTVAAELSASQVVDQLLSAVAEGRFEDAARLTDVSQAGLLSLAEGADANEVVEALEEDAEGVAANFWSGFAQTLDPEFDPASMTISPGAEVEEGGSRFVPVEVTGEDGETRVFYLRDAEGWRVDLLATFGHVVAERLTPRVEALLESANPNAATVVGLLNQAAPSLQLAARNPELDAATHQSILALLERVTRAG